MSPLPRLVVGLIAWLLLTSVTMPAAASAQKDPVKETKSKEPEPSNLDFWLTSQRLQAGSAVQLILARHPITAFVLRKEGKRWSVWNELDFWLTSQRLQAGSAVQVILARHPITAFVLRKEGKRWSVWKEPECLAETAPPLSQELFDDIRDRTPRPELNAKTTRKDHLAYHDLWIEAVRQAFQSPPEAFAKSAQENDHVTFSQLYNSPKKYRGQVVTVVGRLARLKKIDLTLQELTNENIVELYEGFVFDGSDVARKRPPYIVHLLKIPDELARIIKLPQSRKGETLNEGVTVHGYFLKLENYQSGDGPRNAPVLVAPTLILKPGPRANDSPSPISEQFVIVVVGFAVFMIILLTTLSWWFRSGDRQFRDRLTDIHAKSAAAAMEAAEQGLPLAPDIPKEENLKPPEGLPSEPRP